MQRSIISAIFCSAFIFATLLGCQSTEPSVDVAAETQVIAELSQRWAEAEAQRDIEGSLSLVSDDATWLPPDADAVSGKDAVRQLYSDFFDQVPFTALRIDPTSISVSSSGDMAYNWGNFYLDLESPDGTSTMALKFLATWEKRDGEWTVTSNMFSYNAPQSSE